MIEKETSETLTGAFINVKGSHRKRAVLFWGTMRNRPRRHGKAALRWIPGYERVLRPRPVCTRHFPISVIQEEEGAASGNLVSKYPIPGKPLFPPPGALF